ncbi:MAG: lipopolysaccharide biosynthesis protein [Intestinibacter sp.]|uniref:lipopolysaccharide biosynthesis protein n=1 Tax=Intestinibacter sp. TaxID=1965304 RepID=UPI003F16C952
MNTKFKSILENITYTFTANIFTMLISVIMTLILPKFLGVTDYSYYQLYIFFISYVGFFHFGWIDGIYLKIGGMEYDDLNKNSYVSQFWILNIFEIIVAFVVSIFAVRFIKDVDKSFILVVTSICGVITILRTYLLFILQSTNRIKEYAKYTRMDRFIYFVLVILFLFLGFDNYKFILYIDIFSKLVALILCIGETKDIVFGKISIDKNIFLEIFDNISIGIKLMLANIASMLIIGVVRFGIQNNWDIETFGKVSLTLNISNLLMTFINAVAVIMFPLLRREEESNLPKIYTMLRNTLMLFLYMMLIFYYPMKLILSAWLPQYTDSLRYMALLFPICIYESKMSMLVNTYLKSFRKEKYMLIINAISLALSAVLTVVSVFMLNNLTLAILSIVFLLGFRCILGEIVLTKTMNILIYKDIILETALTLIFICSSWFINNIFCLAIYICFYLIYVFIKRKEIKETILIFRKFVRQ